MKKEILDNHALEIGFAVVAIILSVILYKFTSIIKGEVALVIGICATIVSIGIAIIKNHSSKVGNRLIDEFESRIGKYNDIFLHLSGLEGVALTHARKHIDDTAAKLKDIKEGKILLDQETYYDEIIECMRKAKTKSTIYAVNLIDSLRWSNDANQRRYLDENIKAAKRGVNIHRIFVIEKSNLSKDGGEERIENIKVHKDTENITLDIVWSEELTGFKSEIDDLVIFENPERRLYIDYPDPSNRTNVSHAFLYYFEDAVDNKFKIFNKLKNYVIQEEEMLNLLYNTGESGVE